MTDIPHVPQLSEFDRLLAHGPYYERLAMQGAIAGGVVSLFAGKSETRGNLGHAITYAVAGTGLAIGGAFILFQLGKFVSERSHGAVASGGLLEAFKPGTAPPDSYSVIGYEGEGRPTYSVSPDADRVVPTARGLY